MSYQQKRVEQTGQEESLKTKAAHFYCPWCLQFSGPKLRRHMRKNCKHAPYENREVQVNIAIEGMQKAVNEFPKNMFFNKKDIAKDSYSAIEVCELLMKWGHAAIPKHLENQVHIKPTPLAHVYLDRDVEVDNCTKIQTTTTTTTTPSQSKIIKLAEEDLATKEPTDNTKAFPESQENSRDYDQEMLESYNANDISLESNESRVRQPNSNSQGRKSRSVQDEKLSVEKKKRSLTSSQEEESEFSRKKIKRASEYVHTCLYTKGIKGMLQQAGWYEVSQNFADQNVFTLFQRWYGYQRKPFETPVRNTTRLLYNMGGRKDSFSTDCITRENYQHVAEYLKKEGTSAKTLLNYVENLKQFLKFYITDMDIDIEGNDRKEYIRLKLMLEHMKLISVATTREVREEEKHKSKDTQLHPSPYEVQQVIRDAKRQFEGYMKTAGKGTGLGKNAVTFINRYIAAYICLSHGSKPGVIQNLTVAEYVQGTNKPETMKTGKRYYVVMVGMTQSDAYIILEEEWKKIMDIYLVKVRAPIVSQSDNNIFFLQKDGQPFTKISDGIRRLQKQFNGPEYSCTDARKSFESHASRLGRQIQQRVSDFFCYSEKVTTPPYGTTKNAMETFEVFQAIASHYETRNREQLPATEDLQTNMETQQALFTGRRTYHTQCLQKKTLKHEIRLKAAATETYAEYITRSGKKSEDNETDQTDTTIKEKQPDAKTPTDVHKKSEELASILAQQYGSIADSKLPTELQLHQQYDIDRQTAKTVHRKLRYKQYIAILRKLGLDLLAKEAKQKGVKIAELKKTPSVQQADCSKMHTTKINVDDLNKQMTFLLKEYQRTRQ